MFRTRSRRRRLWLGAVVATCSLAGLYGGSASALNLNTSTDTNIAIDGDTHSFQGNLRPVTHGGYQYFAYWDAADPVDGEVYLMLSRRRLSDDNIVTLRFDGTGGSTAYTLDVPFDGHNYVGLGISHNDGQLHLSWSLHTNDRRHRYLQSADNCAAQTQANFTFANCNFAFAWSQTGSVAETELTYPTYFNDSRGRLYMAYRYDASARGDERLNSYNDDGTWTNRGIVLRGRRDDRDPTRYNYTFDPDGAGPTRSITTNERGVYIEEWEFDSRDRLHAVWIWKEHNRPLVWRHGLNYAYSDDFGETWYYENNRRSGQISTIHTDPITILDRTETQVVVVPPGWDIGASGFELDSNGNPHTVIATNEAQGVDDLARYHRQMHYWRTTDKRWHSQFIEGRGVVRKGMTALPGEIFFDHADNAYAIFARNNVDWTASNADIYEQAELPFENVTWQAESGTDGLLDVQLHSATSCLYTIDNITTTISTTGNNQVRVRLRNDTDATDVRVSWQTETAPGWDVSRTQTFPREIRARTGWTPYTFTITDADWRGTLTTLEICPAEGVSAGSQQIDWIDVYNSSTRTTAKLWDFLAPIEMYAAEASQADNWATWNVEKLFPGDGVYVTPADGYFFQDTQRYIDSGRVEFNIHQQGNPGNERLSLRSFALTSDSIIKDWRFDTDPMGWTAYNNRHVTGFAWRDDGAGREKGITGTIAGTNPALLSQEALDTTIRDGRYVHVRMKHPSTARRAQLWFRTAADRTWTSDKSQTVTLRSSSAYETYTFDMEAVGVRGWDRSLLYQIELDPVNDGTTRSGTFVVDRIWIDDTP